MLLAFSKIAKINNNIYLYMVGRDITKKNDELSNLINELDIKKKFSFYPNKKT